MSLRIFFTNSLYTELEKRRGKPSVYKRAAETDLGKNNILIKALI